MITHKLLVLLMPALYSLYTNPDMLFQMPRNSLLSILLLFFIRRLSFYSNPLVMAIFCKYISTDIFSMMPALQHVILFISIHVKMFQAVEFLVFVCFHQQSEHCSEMNLLLYTVASWSLN